MTLLDSLPAVLQPLRRKLPFLITLLLCTVMGTFSWLAHRQLMRAFESSASRDLAAAGTQVQALLQQSTVAMRRQVQVVGSDHRVADLLGQPSRAASLAATQMLVEGDAAARGTTSAVPLWTVWTRDCVALLSVKGGIADTSRVACPSTTERLLSGSRGAWVRPFLLRQDVVSIELVAPVVRGRDTLGFVASRTRATGGQGVRQLRALVGEGSRILLGNASGAPVWTDLARAVPAPPATTNGVATHLARPDAPEVLGIALPLAGAPWRLWVELPLQFALTEERQAMEPLVLLALLCVIVGAVGAWFISAHVTSPLAELTAAADALAAGDYDRRVLQTRRGEIGSLMRSFNNMASQVGESRVAIRRQAEELEHHFHEAQDLAQELEVSNQELIESMDEAHAARRTSTAAESLLDEVMTRAPIGIAVLDRELRFVRVNPALAAMNGRSVRAHYGHRPGDLLPALAESEVRLQHALDTGETSAGLRGSGILNGGARAHWISSYFPVRGPDDTIMGVGAIVMDTTEHHDLEVQLLQAQKMEAVGRLAGGVAHDFNNLLTVITSYSAMAIDSLALEDPLHADMREVLAASERASGLTRQLLAFSRKQVLQPSILNLNDVASEMQRMLSRLIGEDVALALDLAPDVGEVSADRGQLEQVIMNLAINARDAMPDGGQLVIATANGVHTAEFSIDGSGAPAGEFVKLTVSDNGTGMTEETLAHLFEPFFTTKPVGKGTGLGLSTVYGVVKQSGGDIRVRSTPGEGTSFTICLPRVCPAIATGRRPSPAFGVRVGGSETILLVEDDAALRQLARRVLRRAGYTVLEADGAEAALRLGLAHEARIHLLLTDVVMPGMNGRALAEQLNECKPGMRVLFMSGYTDDDVMRRGVIAAQTPFLQKPFTPHRLADAVREVLAGNGWEESP